MPTTTIFEQFQQRGGTAAALASVNEVPLVRQLVFEMDTGKAKLGDGVTAYNSLAYIGNQAAIQFKDEGVNVGSSGAITSLDVVGAGGTLAVVGTALTLTLSGGGGGGAADTISASTAPAISASRAASAETISFGAATTILAFRSATAGSGAYVLRTLPGAITCVIPSGATLGIDKSATATVTIATPGVITYASHRMRPDDGFIFTTTGALPTGITAGTTYYVSATSFVYGSFQFSATVGGAVINTSGSQSGVHTLTWTPKRARVWIVAADDAATIRLGVIRCVNNLGRIFPLHDDTLTSSTAIGTGSDSAGVIYSAVAWTAMPTRVVGYLEYTLGVAGTWDAAPAFVQLWGAGMKLPGDTLQVAHTDIPTAASGSTVTPGDTSTPQITEGDQYFSLSITPRSLCNMLEWTSAGEFECNPAANPAVSLYKDSEANALNSIPFYIADIARAGNYALRYRQFAPTVSAMTGSLRAGSGGGTMRINTSVDGAFTYGGCFGSSMQITELMT